MVESNQERRISPRFPIGFVLEVSLTDTEGISRSEKTELKDFSSGGAKFVTKHPDWYLLYQEIHITACLPGGDTLNALMKGSATVQWISTASGSDGNPEWEVGISIENPLAFGRGAEAGSPNGES